MDINYRDKVEERNQNAAGAAFVLVFLACGVFLFSPGELTMACIRSWLHLDRIQMWLFAILASFSIYGSLWLGLGRKSGTTWYLILCTVITVGFVVAKFGLHQEWWTDWVIRVFCQADAV